MAIYRQISNIFGCGHIFSIYILLCCFIFSSILLLTFFTSAFTVYSLYLSTAINADITILSFISYKYIGLLRLFLFLNIILHKGYKYLKPNACLWLYTGEKCETEDFLDALPEMLVGIDLIDIQKED